MFEWLSKTDKKTAPGSSATGASRSPAASNEGGVVACFPTIDIALQHHQAGRLSEAEVAYRAVLAAEPGNIDALHFLGVIAYQLGNHEQAAELISRALTLNASNAPAHNNLGNVFRAQGKLDEALVCFEKAVALQPEYVDAHLNLGAVFRAQGKLEEAVACYQRALSLAPDFPTAHFNLGNVLNEQGKPEEAVACYRKALALKPDLVEAHFNLGNVLRERGELDKAIACYYKALALKPDFSEAHANLGNVLDEQGKPGEAVSCHRTALALRPDLAEAHFNLGNALRNQGHLDEAMACYRKALVLKPDFPEAHYALGKTLADDNHFNEALDHHRKALSLRASYAEARWSFAMSQIPAVYGEDTEPRRYRAAFSLELDELYRWFDSTRVAEGFRAVGVQTPFYLAYQEENNRELLLRYGNLCTRFMADWAGRQGFDRSARREPDPGIMRVGIVSCHFRNHSVWNAIVKGWFEQLDRTRFALYAFDLGLDQDRETLYAKSRARHFEQGGRSLRQWVEAILDHQPDVLIYPEIGMDPRVVKLASMRLAPVQVASWGHPETTGLPTMDYYLSAEDLEPANPQENYTERLVTLPHLGVFFQSSQVDVVDPDLSSLGIESRFPLLVCPGVPFKYAPQHDRVLTEIARRLGRCRFVFFAHKNRNMSEKLRRRLEVAFTRSRLEFNEFVTFIPWQSRPAFYGLLKRADVFLDTIGFSGFNTAMQAVECGLPVVTREGRFLRGRLASGILKRMGLSELVVESEDDYVALTVRLAQDSGYRAQIRERIEASRHILFGDLAPIRALEDFLVRATNQRGG